MKLIFASQNLNKIAEIKLILPRKIKLLGLNDIGCTEEIPETAATIEGNAILKAEYIAKKYNCNCFADDSGLEVDSLNGEPGVYSARYAGIPKNDGNNIQKLLENLENVANRNANFKTVICLIIQEKKWLFTGIINGTITREPRGTNGFGYDPVFIPRNYNCTFAELSIQEKSAISHRGIAVSKMIDFLNQFEQ